MTPSELEGRGAGNDPSSAYLGVSVVSAGDGRAVAQMVARDDFLNGASVVHGGLVFSLADTALAAAVESTGEVGLTTNADIVFTAPVRPGDRLEATAQVVSKIGRTLIADAVVRRDGDIVMHARGTFRILRS